MIIPAESLNGCIVEELEESDEEDFEEAVESGFDRYVCQNNADNNGQIHHNEHNINQGFTQN